MKKLITLITLTSFNAISGEIDGKALICKVYGNSIGYYFEAGRVIEYKIKGGEKKLELTKSDIGKYYTDENSIFIDEIKIDRKSLKYQRFSSFRGACRPYQNLESMKKDFDISKLTKDNKI